MAGGCAVQTRSRAGLDSGGTLGGGDRHGGAFRDFQYELICEAEDAGFGCASESSVLIASEVRVDILKLEKSCVERIAREDFAPKDTSVLRSLIRSAKVSVIAEGVETTAQAARLREVGIRMAQGWLFSRPLPAGKFVTYFAEHN